MGAHSPDSPGGMELLEDRRMLAYYPNFGGDVAQELSALQQQVNNLLDAQTGIPVLGSAGALDQLNATQFIQEAADKLLNPGLGSYGNLGELQTQLQNLFGPAHTVTQKPYIIGIDVEIPLEVTQQQAMTESSTQVILDTGLAGLPVEFFGGQDPTIDFTVAYDFRLAFRYYTLGDSSHVFQLQDPDGPADELQITLGAALGQGFEVEAVIGFLKAEVTDNTSSSPETS